MKRFFKAYITSFFFLNLFLMVLQAGIVRRLNIHFNFIPVMIGGLIMSLFIALGFLLFNREKGASWFNLLLGFIVMLPSLFVIKYLFGIIIFRFSFAIFLFILLIAIVYSIMVFFATKKAKAEVKEMNDLLKKDQKIEEE